MADVLNVSPSTIRNWAIDFADYLSDNALKGESRHRRFSDDDLAVLYTIAELRRRGESFADIRAMIASGHTLFPKLTFLQLASLRKREVTEGFLQEILTETMEMVALLRDEVAHLRTDLQRTRSELDEERLARGKAERRVSHLESRKR